MIPIRDGVDSLNVAVAGSLLLWALANLGLLFRVHDRGHQFLNREGLRQYRHDPN
jgi:hypothetical protein